MSMGRKLSVLVTDHHFGQTLECAVTIDWDEPDKQLLEDAIFHAEKKLNERITKAKAPTKLP